MKVSVDRNGFFFLLIICISTDIGGYIFGKIFNGPKLTKLVQIKLMQEQLEDIFYLLYPNFFIINYIDYPNQLSIELF